MSALTLLCTASLIGAAPTPSADAPRYDVMAVKSGVALVVKKDGVPTTVTLAGIDTPRTGVGSGAVDRLNQSNYLRTQVPVGSKVLLVDEGKGTHVFRAKDGRWVNLSLVTDGYATASNDVPTRSFPDLQKAEAEARASQRGMWSPDFEAKAARPSKFERVLKGHASSKSHAQRIYTAVPPGGGMPALGLGETAAPAAALPYPLYPTPGMGIGMNGLNPYGFGFASTYGSPFGAFVVSPGGTYNPNLLPPALRSSLMGQTPTLTGQPHMQTSPAHRP